MKEVAKKLILLSLSFVFLFGVVELATRFYAFKIKGWTDLSSHRRTEFDHYVYYRNRAGFKSEGESHNNLGFKRTEDTSIEKPPGVFRIFLVGGSTAYGAGTHLFSIEKKHKFIPNHQSIDAYLERDLEARFAGVDFEVINAAAIGNWTHQAIFLFLSRLEDMDPDMLIALDGNNDFYKYHKEFNQYYTHPYQDTWVRATVDPSVLAMFELFTRIFEDDSIALREFGKRVVSFFNRQAAEKATKLPPIPPLDTQEQQRAFAIDYAAISQTSYLRVYRHLRAITQTAGVDLLIALQPQLFMRDRDSLTPVEQDLADYLDGREATQPNEKLAFQIMHRTADALLNQFEAEGDALYLNTHEALSDLDEQAFTDYCHLTPKGNEVVGKAMADRIHERVTQRLIKRGLFGQEPAS